EPSLRPQTELLSVADGLLTGPLLLEVVGHGLRLVAHLLRLMNLAGLRQRPPTFGEFDEQARVTVNWHQRGGAHCFVVSLSLAWAQLVISSSVGDASKLSHLNPKLR